VHERFSVEDSPSQSNTRTRYARLVWYRVHARADSSFLQACVRRRAVISVMANPNCHDKESAERAVNELEVWESCFNDTKPF
jgi:inner membrane protease ATP23